jgi:Peptidase family M23
MSRCLRVAVAALVAPALLSASAPGRSRQADPSGGYGWPVKPFDRIHPVRSSFGDPRTLFRGPPTLATLYRGAGVFSFHDGIDISAADGSAVYPVRSGTVTSTAACKVIVRTDSATTFEYWHIVPTVETGQRVSADKTVLGHIRRTYGHVHFVEAQHGHPTNPLAPHHLTPYLDTTRPRIERVQFRRPGTVTELLPELLRGVVEVDAPVFDIPNPAAPGEWQIMTTAPGKISWRVERARDHAVRIHERVAFDVRTHLPSNGNFWDVYARGTRQNMATFQGHRYWRQCGYFLYRLGMIDTLGLDDGIYTLVVTADDIRGNTATARITFLVYNHHRWPPKTNQA